MKHEIIIGPKYKNYGGVAQHIACISRYSKFKPQIIEINDNLITSYSKTLIFKKMTAIQNKLNIRYLDPVGTYYSLIKFKKYKIIHTHGHPVWREFYEKTKGPKYIQTVHQWYEEEDAESGWQAKERSRLNYLLLQSCKQSDVVIAVSKYVEQQLLKHGVKSNLIYNGVDFEACKGIKRGDFRAKHHVLRKLVVHPGDSRRVKRPEMFIRLAKDFPEIDFAMIGNNTDKETLEKSLNVNIPKNLYGIGKISHPEALQAYTDADLFILPSKNESFPTSLLESMACGTISIAANSGGSKEIINNGTNGFLFEPDDYTDLVKTFRKALEITKEEAVQMSANAQNKAASFDWKIIAQKIDKVYESLLK